MEKPPIAVPSGGKGNAIPSNFMELLAAYVKIHVPVFQRKYCWNRNQIDPLWRDIQTSASSFTGHTFGKLIFIEKDETQVTTASLEGQKPTPKNRYIVDGQQRLTTISILLSALRDFAKSLKLRGNEKLKAAQKELVSTVNHLLFTDVKAAKQFLKQRKQENQQESNSGTTTSSPIGSPSSIIEEGKKLDFVKLIPSFFDRQPYFACILSITSSLHPSEQSCLTSNMVQARKHFDELILSTFGKLEAEQAFLECKRMMNKTLSNLKFIDFEFKDVDVYAAQQWFQFMFMTFQNVTKHIFKIDRFGMDLTEVDLTRNLLLQQFSTEEEQMRIFNKYWAVLEHSFNHNLSHLNQFLKWYIKLNTAKQEQQQDQQPEWMKKWTFEFNDFLKAKTKEMSKEEICAFVEETLQKALALVSKFKEESKELLVEEQ